MKRETLKLLGLSGVILVGIFVSNILPAALIAWLTPFVFVQVYLICLGLSFVVAAINMAYTIGKMKNLWGLFIVPVFVALGLVALGLLWMINATQQVPAAVVPENPKTTIEGLLVETNKQRATPLMLDVALNETAKDKCNLIEATSKYEHGDVGSIRKSLGREHFGENLALGPYFTNENVVAGWMASPGHRENILDADFKRVGFAVCDYGLQTLIVQHLSN